METIIERALGALGAGAYRHSPVLAAVAAEDVSALEAALAAGGSPAAADADVFALALACRASPAATPGLLRALLRAGADPNQADSNGSTALHDAAQRSNAPAATLLMEAGARVDAVDGGEWTPLTLACRRAASPEGEAVALALLAAGADPNLAERDGRSPLMHAMQANAPRVVRALLAAGADPAARDAKGCNALFFAIAVAGATAASHYPKARAQLVEILREWAARPAARRVFAELDQQPGGMPPLARAALLAHADACVALLNAGADPDQRASPHTSFDGQSARELARGDAKLAMLALDEASALRAELGLAPH